MTDDEPPRRVGRLRSGLTSLAAKGIILILIFVACPLIVYVQFRDADREKTELLYKSVQDQGRLLALALRPTLGRYAGKEPLQLQQELSAIVSDGTKVKVLFRPNEARDQMRFFYVASWPEVSAAYLDAEWQFLMESGLLNRLRDSCAGGEPLSIRYTNPAGVWELLSSITPVHTAAGCWVVLTAIGGAGSAGIAVGQPYWASPQVKIAAAIYLFMAVLVLSVFLGVWRSVRRFARLAKEIAARGRGRGTFAALNRVPELHGVAREFDRMVDGLDASAKAIRDAAEENAHAFKTPIAVIAQAVEPIRISLPSGDERARRSLQLVEQATERLDALVSAARHMDEAIADLISPPRERVDLSRLLSGMLDAYGEAATLQDIVLRGRVAPGVFVAASEDLLEIVIENLLDNAFSFAPIGSEVTATLARDGQEAVIVIADRGPGVEPGNLQRIFDRYFSDRSPRVGGREEFAEPPHFGMGLWIVRRNVEAIGGRVYAENRPDGGLRAIVRLPVYR